MGRSRGLKWRGSKVIKFIVPKEAKVERKTTGTRKSLILSSITQPSLTIVVESHARYGGHEEFDRLAAKGFYITLHENNE
ncbi:hypothetical protein ACVINZ_000952 [Mesorhizobium jarvisii]